MLNPCNRRQLVRAAAGMVLPAGIGCRRARTGELTVAFTPRITAAGLYLAEEQGFFRQAGLKVRRVTQRRSDYLVPLLVDGKIDVGFVQVTPTLLNAVAAGARIRLVAGRDVASRSCGSIGTLYGMRKNFPNGFGDLRVLKGRRVAVSRTTNLEGFCLDADLASAGLDMHDIQVVEMDQAQAVAALVEARIDATVCNFLESRPEGLSPEIVRGPGMADLFSGMQYNFVAFGPSLLDGDPSPGVAFLTAFYRGVRAFASGHYSTALLDILKNDLGMDPQLALQSCRSGSVLDGSIDRPSIQRVMDWAVRKGFCSKPLAISSIVDTRFVDIMNRKSEGERS
ncbi:MAG TPA: ABC transporter substrate-binding protein [Bryobacteraceae bacterium]|nr:ABC transporter substrate-binding protein [Bryobacteraceae bacterium]